MTKVKFENRLCDVQRFYMLLDQLEKIVGRKRELAHCNGHMDWPTRGVYFFFEHCELRTTSGDGMRVVRVGTHALIKGGKATLWDRLSKHQGNQRDGGGNHRGSVFRLHVGTALIARDGWSGPRAVHWGKGANAPKEIRRAEFPLEKAVSSYIGSMPFLWVEIDDDPGPESHRAYIERNCIAMLSNYCDPDEMIDLASNTWLGSLAKNEDVQRSGLWNSNHVRECYDRNLLDRLEMYIVRM